ncbi:GNAT family N-acetyltransferase [Streptomyces sp. NPDC020597]|uniref:GNAT family N-acetyltransferase n=1 Tax=unclassified Streptomyces TaxID=2593676 RepID=UPI0037974773
MSDVTNGGNLSEQKALERLGFSREGVMRGRSFQHGKYVDVLVYGQLRSEKRPGTR